MLIIEKMFKDMLLVFFHDNVLSSDEGWEETKMLGRHISDHGGSLLEEWGNLIVDSVCIDHLLDGDRVVLEDGDKWLFDKGFVDFVGVFYE